MRLHLQYVAARNEGSVRSASTFEPLQSKKKNKNLILIHKEKNYICKASTDAPVTPNPTKDGFCVKRFEDYLPGSDYCYRMFSNWDEFGANDYNLWSKVGKMDHQGLILDTKKAQNSSNLSY